MSSPSFANNLVCGAVLAACAAYHAAKMLKGGAPARTAPVDPEVDAKKKLVVISGCDRGFGYLLAQKLIQNTDYLVLALTLTEKGARALEAANAVEGRETPQRLFVRLCDVTSDADVQRAADSARQIAEEQSAVLFGLVNNAAILSSGDFLFFQGIQEHQRVMDVNFFGQLRLTKALLPLMLETSRKLSDWPRIVNTSSVCGVVSTHANGAYASSKFAVEGWTDALALELEPFAIKVVKMRPGRFQTRIQDDWPKSFWSNYSKAPDDVQELYGGKAFEQSLRSFFESVGSASSLPEPELAVDALFNVLTSKATKLRPSYNVGDDAQTLYRALAMLPESVNQTLLKAVWFKYPVEE